MYYAERDNADEEMAANYKTIPDAMWITLLNLSGESPLCHYSLAGKVMAALMGLVATGLFGIVRALPPTRPPPSHRAH
jgi:hypothetical protein